MTTSEMRVLSYNVRALRDSAEAVGRVIRACNADVVCLQEAPRLLLWRAKRRGLARVVGLEPAVDRRPGGLAILVRPGMAVRAAEHHRLTKRPGLHRRALSMAVLEAEGRRVAVGSTHLDLEERARMDHAGEVLELLDRFAARHRVPRILSGDINCGPDGPAWRLLAVRLTDAGAVAPRGESATFTARRPRVRIDGVFTDPAITVLGAGVPVDLARPADLRAATDHRPVLAGVRL